MQTQIHGGDIYSGAYRMDFSANINPLGMPEAVKAAAFAGVEQSANYPDIQCRTLRAAIARKENVPEDWILCGNGAAELIFTVAAAVQPKKALLTAPGFAEYEQALRSVNCSCQFYTCREENGFLLQEDYLEYITEELDILFLCNPNNPTGLLIQPELLTAILRRCQEKKVLLVLDECFNELLPQPEMVSMKPFLAEYPNLFLLKAFTKLYAMAGLRLGYGMTGNQLLREKMMQRVQPWNISLPAQMAGTAALQEEEYVKRSRTYIGIEAEFLKKGLKQAGFAVTDSQANYIFFRGPEDLYDYCIRQGILIRDCSNYRGLVPGYYRIAVRTRAENEELLRVLGQRMQKSRKVGEAEGE